MQRLPVVLSFAVLAVGLVACGAPGDDYESPEAGEKTPPETSAALAIGTHEWNAADGVRMPYEVAGDGSASTTVVFVHCWMCDRNFWDAQLPAVNARYRTVTLDLPGHGEAGLDREAWRIAGYGDDVAGLIEHLGLDDVILVGHSMGGPVSLIAASQLGGKVRGIVAVDTLHDAEFRYEGEEIEGFMRAFEEDFVGTCEGFVAQMFPEEGVDEVMEQVRASGCNGERAEIGIALMNDFRSVDMSSLFRDAGVPIRAINAAAGQPTRIESNRQYADYDAVLMEGVGHYPHMTRPEEFNPLLMRWIDELTADAQPDTDA